MSQSFTECWSLTFYRYSREWLPEAYLKALKSGTSSARRKMDRALSMISDPETAADLNFKLLRYGTVARHYPGTAAAAYVRAHCDEPYNYDWQRSGTHFWWVD